MRSIHFIINPISGSGKNEISEAFIYNYFPKSEFNVEVFYTQYKNHATALAKASVKNKASIVVASGGDGTINEVASCLVGSNVTLGIVPAGSGNGLASNLNIPLEIEKALMLIKKEKKIKIDVGTVNGNYFFSNSGMGFDAQVIKNYENSNERTITSYIKSSIKALKEYSSNEKYNVSIDGEEIKCQPFMVFVSNSNELGYNLSLTPKASLEDGFFDILIVTKINKIKILLFGLLMLFRKHESLKEVQYYSAKKVVVKKEQGFTIEYQLDGEVKKEKTNTIDYQILENVLSVVC
ncbi:diacylglycerol/lipid kinase family protein [Aquimarina agarilytica]|uniref:diacylglycerol/lipid kinase family protein n=1 Tax=Aquimarina agarilytica TaxID=1087449 RepID=UPI0002894E28|nr:diacylglycerol kinase family protein [Aquimarina agarilytica]